MLVCRSRKDGMVARGGKSVVFGMKVILLLMRK